MPFRKSITLATATMAIAGCNAILGIEPATEKTVPSCADFCASVERACQDAPRAYIDRTTCIKICEARQKGETSFTGTSMDDHVDTLGCRARVASNAPAGETCRLAGPFGGDGATSCGRGTCTVFCTVAVTQCLTGDNPPGVASFPDGREQCERECPSFAYDPAAGDGAITGGNSLNCRLYHLQASFGPGSGDKAFHCQHLGQNSSPCSGAPNAMPARDK